MKRISVLLLVIIIFNFIFCNFSYAFEDLVDGQVTYSKDSYDKLMDKGIVSKGGANEKVSVTTSTLGSTSGIAVSLYSPVFYIFQLIMSKIANSGGLYRTDSDYSAYNVGYFNICSLVFGEYILFDGKLFQTTKSLNPNIPTTNIIEIMDSIKTNASGWFLLIRAFGLGMFLVAIIYAGARLGAATLARDRAVWKKVIMTIFLSMAFVFFVQYIVIFLNYIVDRIMDSLWSIRKGLENNGYSSFEVSLVVNNLLVNTKNASGFRSILYCIEYCVFVVFEVIFFFKYFVRALKLMLLVVISPVIAFFNAWDKISGKDNNVLGEWFSQYISNLVLQPMHAVIYLIFIFTASEIALRAPLLGIVFIWALSRSEKIVKLMLNINTGKIGSLFKR